MRFTFVNQFYPPDVAPTGRLLHDVALRLARRGHDVDVLCGRRAYASGEDLGSGGMLDGVNVHRHGPAWSPPASLAARAAADVAFLLSIRSALRRPHPRPDVVVAATTPPLLGLSAARWARQSGAPLAQWTMDLYPHVLAAHWKAGDRRWGRRLVAAAGRSAFGEAALVLTLGPYMARRVAGYVGSPARVRIVPTWTDAAGDGGEPDRARSWRQRRGWKDGDLVLLYAGNMGRGHRFGEFLDAAGRLGPGGPVWAFAGGGPRRREIERFHRRHPSASVELLPYVAEADLRASLCSADVHLVSLSSAWQGLIVPSKLQAAFGVGRPVLFVGASDNEVAAAIHASGGGWVVGEGNVDALMAAAAEARDPEERSRRGAKALAHARAHFDRDRNAAEVADLLEGCLSPDAAGTGVDGGDVR